MKINYLQLTPHLDKKLFPIYLVAGDEWWLKQDAVKLILKAAKKSNFTEYFSFTIDNQFSWEQIYNLLYSHSLMGEKRLIHLKLNETSPNKLGGDILSQYSKQFSPDFLLLIEMGKITGKNSQATWLPALEKMGCLINIWPIPRENLPKWIIERAKKKYKLTFSQETATLLAHYVEGNLSAASQFLEKLYLLQPNQPIDTALIQQLAKDESLFNIFDLTDNLIAGNKEKSLHILNHLKNEGIEPTLILWSILRELRMLIELSTQSSQGVNWTTLIEKYRIFSHRQGIIRQFLSHYTLGDCLELLKQAGEIDRIIKGALPYHVWHALQFFSLKVMYKNA